MPNILKLTDEEYFSDKTHVSKSMLDLLEKSPAHLATYLKLGNPRQTAALEFGRMFHKYILEHGTFFDFYCVLPKFNRRTTNGKLDEVKFKFDNKQKICIELSELEYLDKMREVVLCNRCARLYINHSDSQKEIAVKWKSSNGVLCRAKADIFNDSRRVLVDLKTYDNRNDFISSIIKYRYDVQAAHYCEGFEVDDFMIIAVSKQLDCCEVFQFTNYDILTGNTKRNKNLDEYKIIIENDMWPGHDEPLILNLPESYDENDVEFDL